MGQQIPLVMDTNDTERSRANSLLRDLGIGQAEMAARLADRGDASHNLVGIGDAGSPSMNPLALGATPLPPHIEVNPAPSPTTAVPAGHFDAMQVTTKPVNYIQPNVITPPARATTTPTVRNPMGL